jgi:hypothetical protein
MQLAENGLQTTKTIASARGANWGEIGLRVAP